MLVERTKRCASCAATKLARDFYSDAASDDRLSAYCAHCHKRKVARRRKRLAARQAAARVEEQECRRCRIVKPAAEFHPSVWELSGLAYVCKECLRTGSGNSATSDEKRCRVCCEVKSTAEFHKNNASSDGLAARCRACESIARAAYVYGIDFEVAKALRSHPACDVCGRALTEKTRCIDHCHATLEVRGVLCTGCNIMLGMAQDEPACLDAGAAYLRRAEKMRNKTRHGETLVP
jgi:hypothetical protein